MATEGALVTLAVCVKTQGLGGGTGLTQLVTCIVYSCDGWPETSTDDPSGGEAGMLEQKGLLPYHDVPREMEGRHTVTQGNMQYSGPPGRQADRQQHTAPLCNVVGAKPVRPSTLLGYWGGGIIGWVLMDVIFSTSSLAVLCQIWL